MLRIHMWRLPIIFLIINTTSPISMLARTLTRPLLLFLLHFFFLQDVHKYERMGFRMDANTLSKFIYEANINLTWKSDKDIKKEKHRSFMLMNIHTEIQNYSKESRTIYNKNKILCHVNLIPEMQGWLNYWKSITS